jgi:VIT1/CCC1 family predicted Fe2+/Mn2+ transporter
MVGAAFPLAVSTLAPESWRVLLTVVAVVVALSGTATAVARLGGMRVGRTVLRTVTIGLLTMLLTLAGGSLFDL